MKPLALITLALLLFSCNNTQTNDYEFIYFTSDTPFDEFVMPTALNNEWTYKITESFDGLEGTTYLKKKL